MGAGLTPKQEAFCLAFVETGNASEAYRRAYDASAMQSATINRKAKELTDNGKIAARLEELRGCAVERHNVTIDTIRDMLLEDRAFAKECATPGPAVTATTALAKLYGLMSDKTLLGSDPDNPLPPGFIVNLVKPDDAEG